MPWYSKEQPTPFDHKPISGLYYLDGALLARRYGIESFQSQSYPTVTYPSGLQCELWDSPDGGGFVNIFGALELNRVANRDEGFQQAIAFADEYDYTIGRRGDNELLVFNPYSGRGYTITYDNTKREIANVIRIPDYAMELLDIQHRAILPELYSNENTGLDAPALVKFFTPDANWTWYASEYDGENTFFGLVSGLDVELGYFSLTELEAVKGALNLPVERDLFFQPTPLRTLIHAHRSS